MPGSGLISDRSHTAGEKIHCDAFGCVREVLALNGHSTVRLLAVAADRQLDFPHLVARVAELAQLLELRPALAHVFEGLAAHVELAAARAAATRCPRVPDRRRTAPC